MGGHATITLVGGSEGLLDRAFALADRCEALWSRFLPLSDISRLNWAEGKPVQVDALTIRLVESMREAYAMTQGDFDPTLLPWVLTAGYTASVVAPDLVTSLPDSARAPGNLAAVRFGDGEIVLPRGTVLDAGGIGKGLTADLVCAFALAEGAQGIMAEISGDIVVGGLAPDGIAWRLGVEDPEDATVHKAIVRLPRGAIVTSSTRRRRFAVGPEERHHLIDPQTGGSARDDIATVTVIAATGAKAEALTKPGFRRETRTYLDWLPTVGAAGLVMTATGETLTSSNWERYIC